MWFPWWWRFVLAAASAVEVDVVRDEGGEDEDK